MTRPHVLRLAKVLAAPEKAGYPTLLEIWRSLPADAPELADEAGERFLDALLAARERSGRHARGIERRIPWLESQRSSAQPGRRLGGGAGQSTELRGPARPAEPAPQ